MVGTQGSVRGHKLKYCRHFISATFTVMKLSNGNISLADFLWLKIIKLFRQLIKWIFQ